MGGGAQSTVTFFGKPPGATEIIVWRNCLINLRLTAPLLLLLLLLYSSQKGFTPIRNHHFTGATP